MGGFRQSDRRQTLHVDAGRDGLGTARAPCRTGKSTRLRRPEEVMVSYEKFIADIYDSSPFFGQGKARELEKFNAPYFRHLKGRPKRVLEFGSGTGMLTIPLARAGYELDSVDISPFMHDVLSRKLQHEDQAVQRNVNQIVADATTYAGSEP